MTARLELFNLDLANVNEVNQMLGYFTEFTNISNLIDQTLLERAQPANVLGHRYGESWASPTNDTTKLLASFRKGADGADESSKDHELFHDHSSLSPRPPVYSQMRITPLELMKPPKTAGDVNVVEVRPYDAASMPGVHLQHNVQYRNYSIPLDELLEMRKLLSAKASEIHNQNTSIFSIKLQHIFKDMMQFYYESTKK